MTFSMIITFLLVLYGFFQKPVHALYDPLSVPNNKYGIHVAELADLKDAANLLNSSNGDWGYVTLVIQDGDRNHGKWQDVFHQLRKLHLIPIIRLATHPEGNSWKIPQKEDAERWAGFLNSLLWPTENRYVILFNEPNHAKEWGNTIQPEEYADIALHYANTFKQISPDFFLLPAGLDMSASSDGSALEGSQYLTRMHRAKPELFTVLDGWTSHSYPNPAFSGSPAGSGKGSIASFQWEIEFLKSLGVTKPYPIFITETGWTHTMGIYSKGVLSPDVVGQYLTRASTGIWSDSRIAAITPFLLNYQGAPFDNFSWKKMNSSEYFSQYGAYQKIEKTKGTPNQRESFALETPLLPERLIINSSYTFVGEITNTGQSIVDPDTYSIQTYDAPEVAVLGDTLPRMEPMEKRKIQVFLKTPSQEGVYQVKINIQHNQKLVPVEEKQIDIVPPPTLTLNATFGWKKTANAKNSTVLIYDQKDTLLHKFQNVKITDGQTSITGLYNIIPGETYRVVLIVPYYLPRQQIVSLEEKGTLVPMKRLYPIDFNGDGTVNLLDVPALFLTKPHTAISRIF